jgi:2,3-bisphosphoglycerate-dependent phosphoglycerate mutase
MSHLVLARHGESQFNAKSLWTGIWDVPLTKKGRHEAMLMAAAIKDLKPDVAYTSALSRAKDTLEIILHTNEWNKVPVHADASLNERDYGDLTGMNKWAVEEKYGQSQFNKWRRGWNEPVPDGETLQTVFRRAIPYFDKHVLPDLIAGKDVILVAHGNTLRALIKSLDELTDRQVENLEMPFGEILVYEQDSAGNLARKETLKIDTTPPPA